MYIAVYILKGIIKKIDLGIIQYIKNQYGENCFKHHTKEIKTATGLNLKYAYINIIFVTKLDFNLLKNSS